MELKGVEEINNIINNFVSKFECTAEMGLDFSYYYATNTIEWTFFITEITDDSFIKFLEEKFPDINCNIFIWSLLHEVGHHETIDSWTYEEQECFDKEKDRIQALFNQTSSSEYCFQYYSLPDEMLATTWAANYIRNNKDEIRTFYEEFRSGIYRFAELNDIDLAS